MEYRTTSGYPTGCGIYCDTCGKGINPADGHYHCPIAREDYHPECLKMDVEFKVIFDKEQEERKKAPAEQEKQENKD